MKRELAFALEVQTQLAGSLGRTRASRPQTLSSILASSPVEVCESVSSKRLSGSVSDGGLIVYTRRKKLRLEDSGDKSFACSDEGRLSNSVVVVKGEKPNCNVAAEMEIEGKENAEKGLNVSRLGKGDAQWAQVAVGGGNGDLNMSSGYGVRVEMVENALSGSKVVKSEAGLGTDGSTLATATKKNLELKMSKKILVHKKPSTVKELFETGLLEGVTVVYMGGMKAYGLRGTIKDAGILCSCSMCKSCNVVPPSQFEIHACKAYKRAAQYICFENGKSLLEVLKICRLTPLHLLETAIQKALNALPTEKMFTCKSCKGSFPAKFVGKTGPVCHSCVVSKEAQCSPSNAAIGSDRSPGLVLPPKSKSASVCVPLDRDSRRSTPRSSKSVPIPKPLKKASPPSCSDNKSRSNIKKKLVKPLLSSKSSKKAFKGIHLQKKNGRKMTKKSAKPYLISKPAKKDSACRFSQPKTQRKITTKDQRLHKLIFEEGGLADGSVVAYFGRGQKLLDGYKTASGIFCCCCNSEVSPSQFEAHAGWGSRRKPYSYIYTSDGVSLHELSIHLSRGRRFSTEDNDSLCTNCLDGGDLLCCDGCPRAFHKECVSLSSVPRGNWYCTYCQTKFLREKFVEHNANAVAAGRMSGTDPIKQITQRCVRVVKDIRAGLTGCALCKGHDYCKSGFGPRTIILCDQCEKEYHVGCLRSNKMADLKRIPEGDWFCCTDCTRIHSTLQKLIARGSERLPESILDTMSKKCAEEGSGATDNLNVSWRVLSGEVTSRETRLLLSEAIAIFHECFDPINDLITLQDLIPSMVYGRNTKGHELRGMYCAVLTVDSHVASAAVFRIFGREVAELPLVATRKVNHGKGYFRILYTSIEKLLVSLKVSNLVLPAAEEAQCIWTEKFAFTKMKPDQLIAYRKCWTQMLTFQGTTMLEKVVPQCQSIESEESVESHQDEGLEEL